MPFKEISQPGGWFKPADHEDDVALLFEVKRVDRQRPTPNGPKDSVVCDITTFATPEDLEAGEASSFAKGQRVEQTVLAADLIEQVGIGNELVSTVTQTTPTKPGQRPAWVFRNVSKTVQNKVADFYEAREAAFKAALADAPDFDDDDE